MDKVKIIGEKHKVSDFADWPFGKGQIDLMAELAPGQAILMELDLAATAEFGSYKQECLVARCPCGCGGTLAFIGVAEEDGVVAKYEHSGANLVWKDGIPDSNGIFSSLLSGLTDDNAALSKEMWAIEQGCWVEQQAA